MRKFTKTLSVILAVMMALTMVMPAFAAETQGVVCPEIYVPGFATNSLYTNKDGKKEELLLPETDYLLGLVKEKLVPAFIGYAANEDAQKLAYSITDVINTAAEDWFNNPDGSATNGSGAAFVYPAATSIRKSSRVSFRYDWRGNPIEIAEQLNDYIDYVLECSGSDKVALSSHSLGSIVILTYISIYGDDKVMGIVFDSPTVVGITSVGELFSGNAEFREEGIEALLKLLVGETEYEELLASIVDIFTMAGINGSISDFLNEAYDEVGDIVMKETLFPLFGRWLTVWAMIPDEYIEDVMAYSFDSGRYDDDYDALKLKIQEYNEKVRKNKIQTLEDFDKEGRFAVISRYGYSAVPASEEWTMLGDGVIETVNSSFGATTAKVGECFGEDYLEGKDMKYISPDRTVDASTCLFAEKTWFVKNYVHNHAKVTSALSKTLLFGAKEATCDNSELARFMIYDSESGKLVEDKSEPVKAEKLTVLQRIFNFVKALIDKILELLGK